MNAHRKSEPNELRVGAIIADSLPDTLLTADAPDRYTVSAVFNRRPTRTEIDEVHGNATRLALTDAGHPTVELRVSDRRLEISNTNLEELADGLASVIARRLHLISLDSAAAHERFEAELLMKTQKETDRAALVALAAAAVTFTFAPSPGGEPSSSGEGANTSPDPTWFDVRNDHPVDS